MKTIGDAIMLRIPDPGQAILLGLHITHGLMLGHGAPAVRVGLHHGSAIERDDDYFGAAVNLAARVSGVATGGEVLLTAHTAALAPELEGVFYEPRGREALRNIREPVELSPPCAQARRRRASSHATPSAGWQSIPTVQPGRLMHEGTAYFFCTLACAGSSLANPSATRRAADGFPANERGSDLWSDPLG